MVLEHGSWSAARNRWVLAVRGGLACAGWGVSQTCCGAVFFGSLLYTTPGPGYMCIVLEPDILLCLICAQQSISLLMDHPAKQVSSWLQGCRSVVSTVTISPSSLPALCNKGLKKKWGPGTGFPEMLWMPHPWSCSRPGWREPWAT